MFLAFVSEVLGHFARVYVQMAYLALAFKVTGAQFNRFYDIEAFGLVVK